jgi:hypothetical protein
MSKGFTGPAWNSGIPDRAGGDDGCNHRDTRPWGDGRQQCQDCGDFLKDEPDDEPVELSGKSVHEGRDASPDAGRPRPVVLPAQFSRQPGNPEPDEQTRDGNR